MKGATPVRWLLNPLPLVWQVRVALSTGLLLTNIVGIVVLFFVAQTLIPVPDVPDRDSVRLQNFELSLAALVIGTAATVIRSRSLVLRLAEWLREDRAPTDEERRAILMGPSRLFAFHSGLWVLGVVLFGLVNARLGMAFGVLTAVMVALSGLSVCALTYLVAERALRPLARRALAGGVPDRAVVPSVAARSIVAWALSSGVAMLGLGVAGVAALVLSEEVTETKLAVTMLVLGVLGFGIGGITNALAAKASSDPVRSLRDAIARVGEGDLDTHVDIYDATEIGLLQVGFNQMVHGLREREQLRDLFGRHVGDDVARAALSGGVRLGGESRHVAVLFVDIIGSTTIATERPPEEVVALLNRFFDVVIDVVHDHEGWINKFEGDAALAVWGAPVAVPGMEAHVLRAARVMGRRLAEEVPELAAGIGVSAGTAVAGNVGAAERYEYTVIGDPVNEAARLTGLAKTVPGHVVANAGLLDAAGDEAAYWEMLEPVVVRGRPEASYVAAPRL